MKPVRIKVNKSGRKDVFIYVPEHPNSWTNGYILESRLVMEKMIERYLKKEEVVHHINGDTLDNRPENLQLFKNNSEHLTKYKISYKDIRELIKSRSISHNELILRIMKKFDCNYFVGYRTIDKFFNKLENDGIKIRKCKVSYNDIRESIGNDIVSLSELCWKIMDKVDCAYITAERAINKYINRFDVQNNERRGNLPRKFFKIKGD